MNYIRRDGDVAAALLQDVLEQQQHDDDADAIIPEGCSKESYAALMELPKFVINVDRDHDRFMQFAMNNARLGKSFSNTCRVQAVDGMNCDNIVTPQEAPFPKVQKMAGPVAVSHMSIWRYVLDNNITAALIMEDDTLADRVSNFLGYMCEAVSKQEDWDMFRPSHLQIKKSFGHERFTAAMLARNKHFYRDYKWTGQHVNEWRHMKEQCRNFYGTDMYMITKEFAKDALHSYDIYKTGLVDDFNKYAKTARHSCFDVPITGTSGEAKMNQNSENMHPQLMHSKVKSELLRTEAAKAVPDCPAAHLQHSCWGFEDLSCTAGFDCDGGRSAIEEVQEYE